MRKLKIVNKEHFGVRVINENGDAELGNWHIADFSWREDAEFFVQAQIMAGKTEKYERKEKCSASKIKHSVDRPTARINVAEK